MTNIVVISAGISVPSSARILADSLGKAAARALSVVEEGPLGARLETADAELVETAAEHEAIDDLAPKAAPAEAHTSAELLEQITGTAVDSPLCMTCGTKMRPAGSCYVCEGCGSTSGCS